MQNLFVRTVSHVNAVSGFDNFSVPQAPGAYFQPFYTAVNEGAHFNKIGFELTPGQIMRMTHIMPEHTFFSTDITNT